MSACAGVGDFIADSGEVLGDGHKGSLLNPLHQDALCVARHVEDGNYLGRVIVVAVEDPIGREGACPDFFSEDAGSLTMDCAALRISGDFMQQRTKVSADWRCMPLWYRREIETDFIQVLGCIAGEKKTTHRAAASFSQSSKKASTSS